MEGDVELAADAQRIGAVTVGLAFAEALVFLPVLHEQAGDVGALTSEQQRGDG